MGSRSPSPSLLDDRAASQAAPERSVNSQRHLATKPALDEAEARKLARQASADREWKIKQDQAARLAHLEEKRKEREQARLKEVKEAGEAAKRQRREQEEEKARQEAADKARELADREARKKAGQEARERDVATTQSNIDNLVSVNMRMSMPINFYSCGPKLSVCFFPASSELAQSTRRGETAR